MTAKTEEFQNFEPVIKAVLEDLVLPEWLGIWVNSILMARVMERVHPHELVRVLRSHVPLILPAGKTDEDVNKEITSLLMIVGVFVKETLMLNKKVWNAVKQITGKTEKEIEAMMEVEDFMRRVKL